MYYLFLSIYKSFILRNISNFTSVHTLSYHCGEEFSLEIVLLMKRAYYMITLLAEAHQYKERYLDR